MTEEGQEDPAQNKELREPITKEEIKNRLRLFHSIPTERWEKAQKTGALLSEAELLRRGLISVEDIDIDDLEEWKDSSSSTGAIDREIGNDRYVFLSTIPQTYGGTLLEIKLDVLELPGVIVNTAGDYLHFKGTPDLERYYKQSQIPGERFLDYLEKFVNDLPNPNWFFGERDEALLGLIREAMNDHSEGKYDKYKLHWALYPEVMVPKELPLRYVKE